LLSAKIRHYISIYKGNNLNKKVSGAIVTNKYNMPISPRKIVFGLQDLKYIV